MFRMKLQKLIEKEEKIRDIVEAPNHCHQNKTNNDSINEGDGEMLLTPISLKTTYISKELPDRSTLLKSLTESQLRVSYRKETLLKQLSEDIHHRLE